MKGWRGALVKELEGLFPLQLAEEWDNVGLLIQGSTEESGKGVLLTNDLTESVLQEAISLKTPFVFSYHPVLFRGAKRLTEQDAGSRIAMGCVRHGITVYSPHTACDNAPGGVNDWLASIVTDGNQIGTVDPIVPRMDIQGAGSGRMVTLQKPCLIGEIIASCQKKTGISHLRFAPANNLVPEGEKRSMVHESVFREGLVTKVAVQAGSGISVLNPVRGADLWITGEMSHHELLAANSRNISVILLEHSNSERNFLYELREKIAKFGIVMEDDIHVSIVDSDPIVII